MDVAASGGELHVVARAQGRHPDVDVAIAAAHLDRPLDGHDVHIPVAGRDVHARLGVPHFHGAVPGRDANLALGLHHAHPAVSSRGMDVAPGALDTHRAVARRDPQTRTARHEHRHRHGHATTPPAVVPAVPVTVARALGPRRADLDVAVARLANVERDVGDRGVTAGPLLRAQLGGGATRRPHVDRAVEVPDRELRTVGDAAAPGVDLLVPADELRARQRGVNGRQRQGRE